MVEIMGGQALFFCKSYVDVRKNKKKKHFKASCIQKYNKLIPYGHFYISITYIVGYLLGYYCKINVN